jgi:hypothetical protein
MLWIFMTWNILFLGAGMWLGWELGYYNGRFGQKDK